MPTITFDCDRQVQADPSLVRLYIDGLPVEKSTAGFPQSYTVPPGCRFARFRYGDMSSNEVVVPLWDPDDECRLSCVAELPSLSDLLEATLTGTRVVTRLFLNRVNSGSSGFVLFSRHS